MGVKNWLGKKTSRRSILKGAAAGGLGAIAAKIAGDATKYADTTISVPEAPDVVVKRPIPTYGYAQVSPLSYTGFSICASASYIGPSFRNKQKT